MDRPPPGQVLPRCCVGTLRGRPGAPRTDHACQLPIRLGHPCGSSPSSAPGPSTALVTATSPGGFTPCRHTATSPTASDTPIGCCHCCWTSRSGTGAYTGMTRRTSICRGCLRQVHDLAKALDAWPAGENERRRAAYDAHMDLRGRASSKVPPTETSLSASRFCPCSRFALGTERRRPGIRILRSSMVGARSTARL